MKGRVMKTDSRYLLVNLYVWLWRMVLWPFVSWDVSCSNELHEDHNSFSNMADIPTEVIHAVLPVFNRENQSIVILVETII